MATFLYKTKGNSSPERKPRVYFTCHPDDFSKHFEKICADIFATHDCAIYYTETMTEKIEEKYKESDLGQMNLFVIPVTFKLLIQPNRAMDSDFRYAQKKHIPVLPIMMETGLDEFYSKADKFGEAQYLSPYVQDLTAISYEEKLKKYLESVLISNEMAERVRKAFDAYIFLSYRKKDRHYANELMKMIHSHPEFRDIAIWYDEFLTPGESFRQNIEKMMKDSKLFTLLVTPNLLEYVDGKPNYVMAHEYPEAKVAGIDILPAEMEKTNVTELRSKYKNIPECVNPNEDEQFKKRLADTLSKIPISANNTDPEHNFLIGLAYLDGIDVEKNTERGIELITSAAEANLLEAMEKLYDMYNNGKGIQVDYQKAVYWAKRIWKYCVEKFNEEHPYTLIALNNLAVAYVHIGDLKKALELQEKDYALRCKILGENHHLTLLSLHNIAGTYFELGLPEKSLELQEKIYILFNKILGKEHFFTLQTRSLLAVIYRAMGNYEKAFELNEKNYVIIREIFGEEHPSTIHALNNLASSHNDPKKTLELKENAYQLHCKIWGEKHPHTLSVLHGTATAYNKLGNHQKAISLLEIVYANRAEILGAEHPKTLVTLNALAVIYGESGNQIKALSLQEKAYAVHCKILGQNNPNTKKLLFNLAYAYYNIGNYPKAMELFESLYAFQSKFLGQEHDDTISTMLMLTYTYGYLDKYQKKLELEEKLYTLCCNSIFEKNPTLALTIMNNLSSTYINLGNHQKALELQEKIHILNCKDLGEDHPNTLVSLNNLAYIYGELGEYPKALTLFEKAYLLRCKVSGKEHPDTLLVISNIARIENKVENHQRAFELQEKVYTLRCKVLGKDDPKTIKAKERLEEYREKLNP